MASAPSFPRGAETKDLRAQWALEETGLPYRVRALDHTGGELDGDAYRRISPFRQVPVIDDDGFVVAESAAVVLYLAEKAGKLIPGDVQGRTRVVQWCFAATSSRRRCASSPAAGSETSSAASKTASGSPALISRWPTS